MTIKNIPIIDTHFHIWNSTEFQMEWLNLFGGRLKDIYTPEDYENATKNHNIVKSCYAEVDVAKKDQNRESELAVKHCVNSFGEDRIVYASNWPVCDITGSIGLWLEALEFALPDYSKSFWHKLLHKNADKYYRL